MAADGFEPETVLAIARGGLLPADTGKTLEVVLDLCAGHVSEVRSAVVYEKPRSVVRCDDAWKRTDAWIDFPWSAAPPVVRRAGEVLDA